MHFHISYGYVNQVKRISLLVVIGTLYACDKANLVQYIATAFQDSGLARFQFTRPQICKVAVTQRMIPKLDLYSIYLPL